MADDQSKTETSSGSGGGAFSETSRQASSSINAYSDGGGFAGSSPGKTSGPGYTAGTASSPAGGPGGVSRSNSGPGYSGSTASIPAPAGTGGGGFGVVTGNAADRQATSDWSKQNDANRQAKEMLELQQKGNMDLERLRQSGQTPQQSPGSQPPSQIIKPPEPKPQPSKSSGGGGSGGGGSIPSSPSNTVTPTPYGGASLPPNIHMPTPGSGVHRAFYTAQADTLRAMLPYWKG